MKVVEAISKLEKDVLHLQRLVKESVAREKVLANRVAALSKQVNALETAHGMLRNRVAQSSKR